MKCTKCGGEFQTKKLKGIEIDQCSNCNSIWLDYNELDQLEDTVWDHDELKGSLFYGTQPSSILCPKCGKMMQKINYRFYDLELEICPDSHGFYLDANEEKRILELIKKEKKATKRKFKSEEEWTNSLKRMKSRSFWSKLRTFMKS
jgi:Zn-finger nucleic acid-binding protein